MADVPETKRLGGAEDVPYDVLSEELALARVRDGLFAGATVDPDDTAEGPTVASPDVDPVRIGRFVVLRRLGSGGMGAVYAAYDEQLDRKIAVKVLRGRLDDVARARVSREAQAMAKLAHPNVVQVYDVGEDRGRMYIAMEYVDGETLGRWRVARERSWSEILAAYRQAGRGLVAAHDAGLVHRDFKPHNVMVSERGSELELKVLDFGLARRHGDDVLDTSVPSLTVSSSGDDKLTEDGMVVGTPAYMAPEQFAAGEITGAADQFSFCIAVWEALYGRRPFTGETHRKLSDNVIHGRREAAPSGTQVPGWVHDALVVGLSVEPEERWPSMQALLEALSRDPARTRRRWFGALAAVGLLAAAAAGVDGIRSVREQRVVAACEAEGAEIESVWNPQERAELREGLLASGAGHAAMTSDRIMPWLDDYAQAWRSAKTEGCLDVKRGARWDSDTLDRSAWCLEERRLAFGALVGLLQDADADAVTRAVPAAAGLRSLEHCRDEHLLSRLPLPSADQRQDVQSVRASLAEASAMQRAGKYDEALVVAQQARDRAEALSWPPLQASARLQVGQSLEKTGDYQQAEVVLESAYFEAAKARIPRVGFVAAQRLAHLVGVRRADRQQGERWYKHSEAMRADLSDAAGLDEARSHGILAGILHAHGEYSEAEAEHRREIELRAAALGPDHPDVAGATNNLANVLMAQAKYDEAEATHRRVLALRESALGPEHPYVATSRFNIATVLSNKGQFVEAKAEHEAALALRVAALGPEHPVVTGSRNNLAVVLARLGEFAEAEAELRIVLERRQAKFEPGHRAIGSAHNNLGNALYVQSKFDEALVEYRAALEIGEATVGPEHPDVGQTRSNVAMVLTARGDYAAAEAEHRAALAVRLNALGADHPDVAQSRSNLAHALQAQRKYSDAVAQHRAALAIVEKAYPPEHPDLARCRHNLAFGLKRMEKFAEALPLAEAAWARRDRDDIPAERRGETAFLLAQLLWSAPAPDRDRARARTLADDAKASFGTAGESGEDDVVEVEQWLEQHPAP